MWNLPLLVLLLGIIYFISYKGSHFISGRQIKLNCQWGRPYNFVDIQHNGNQVNKSDRISILRTYSHRRLVIINHAQPTDEGTWTCTVSHSWSKGKLTASAKLIHEG